jgi:hypothetical protein
VVYTLLCKVYVRSNILCAGQAMMSQLTVPEIAEKIGRLYFAMREQESPEIIAKEINDILIYGDKVPLSLLKSA